MATYKQIFGKQIKFLSSDPTNESEGQIWYNSTSGTFKSTLISEAWSSGSPLSQARGQLAMFGTQDAAVGAGGSGPGATMYNDTEEYNGTGWATGGDLNTTREGLVGAGIITAGVVAGGFIEPSTYSNAAEEYNGTAWTSVTVAPYAAQGMGSFGTQAAAVFAGGDPGSKNTALDYTSPGSWTAASGTLNTGRAQLGSAGQSPATAGAVFGGTPLVDLTEEYNGTAWAVGGVLPAGVQFGGGAGIQTAALSVGGMSGPTTITTATNKYDGTSWTTAPTLGTAQGRSPGNGSQTKALLAGGDQPHSTPVATTQEWNVSSNVITAAAWASGGAYPINVLDFSGAGTTTASIAFGGRNYPGPNGPTAVSATYDGSSWTGGPSLTSARQLAASAKNGTTTAALCTGGYTTTVVNLCEEFNGSSWAEGPNYPTTAQFGDQGVGIQTAALIAGGYGGGPGSAYLDGTSTYDGSSWTALSAPSNLQDSRFGSTTTGTSTAALMMAGVGGAGKVESWNGSAWSEQTEAITARTQAGSSGTSTDALYFGGEDSPTATAVTEHWNGTSWATRPNMGTASRQLASSGASSTSALAIGGSASPGNLTEEYTGETTAANYKTITTS